MDVEKKTYVYSIEMLVDSTVYQLNISAFDGKVVKSEKGHINTKWAKIVNEPGIDYKKIITTATAGLLGSSFKELDLDVKGGALVFVVKLVNADCLPYKAYLDEDDGRHFYEIDVLGENKKVYEIKINAISGEIFRVEIEN